MSWIPCKRLRDAEGCYCPTCDSLLADDCSPFWHFSKSKYLHEHGTGHEVLYVRRSNLTLTATDGPAPRQASLFSPKGR